MGYRYHPRRERKSVMVVEVIAGAPRNGSIGTSNVSREIEGPWPYLGLTKPT